MNEMGKKFRNAVGGYNKEDVNTYIREMDQAYQERQDIVAKELADLRIQQDALMEEKNALETDRKALQEQIQQQTTQLAAMEETRSSLQEQLNTLRTEKEDQEKNHADAVQQLHEAKTQLEETVSQLTQTKEQLQSQLIAQGAEADKKIAALETALTNEKTRAAEEIEQFKAAFNEDEEGAGYKIRMYDRISGQIGDILLGANRDADDILNRAKEEAEQMRTETADALTKERSAVQAELEQLQADTKAEAMCVRKKLSETVGTMLADISGEMHLNIENCLKELSTCMTEVESDTETLFQTMQRRYQEMNERIQYYQSYMQEHIDAHLIEMDEQYAIQESGREN